VLSFYRACTHLTSGLRFASVIAVCEYNFRQRTRPASFLAEADDGLLYVVRFRNNQQGPNVLFNESIGTELYRALGLPVADWSPLFVSDHFIENNPECWFATETEDLKPISGPCFGSRLLDPPLKEILPANWYGRIRNQRDLWLAWAVDIGASHTDNRQVAFRHSSDFELNAYFIDHGDMFGGPKGEMRSHFVASRYMDPRIYPEISTHYVAKLRRTIQCLDADRLWQRMDTLPQDWEYPFGPVRRDLAILN
jgi:hypothetical protein